MSLLLRYDADRQAVASLGDPPNGLIIACPHGDGVGFGVSPSWQPSSSRLPLGQVAMRSMGVDEQAFEPIGTEDAVDGCADATVATALWMAGCAVVETFAGELFRSGDVEMLGAAVEFACELRDLLVERGYLEVG